MLAHDIPAESILVLTFTNKAAKEMKERGETLLQEINYTKTMPEFTTFHTWGMRFLRKYIGALHPHLEKNFSIADENVQEGIVKELIKEVFGEKQKIFESNHFLSITTIIQNNLVSYKSFKETEDEIRALLESFKKAGKPVKLFQDNNINTTDEFRKFIKVYVKYKIELRKNNLVDFDDLINLPIQILKENKDIRTHIKNHYQYIMIDEFQDTNYAQITLMNLLLNEKNNICVVGDDSQSIYGWRGADIEYILQFHKGFNQDVLKINLIHNYRSSKNIVGRANQLLKSATQKHEFKEALKAFVTEKGRIMNKTFEDANVEARAVAYYIDQLVQKGVNPKNIAILYRSNFIVPAFEKELIKKKLPYKIFKGRALLQKKSIQEFLHFFQCFINDKNSVSIEQALLSKAKYITPGKLLEIKNELIKNEISLADYLFNGAEINIKLTKTVKDKLDSFVKATREIREMIEAEVSTIDIYNYFEENFTFVKEHRKTLETSTSVVVKETATKALTDIGLIASVLKSFATIDEFMETVTLDTADEEDEDKNKVNLMTVHASKGLEFEYVFIVRMNQGIFPSNRSLTQPLILEEERRLAYVSITRAKRFLHISNIKYGFNGAMTPSQFIAEAGLDKE
jgi:DNA helicase-2/ATP-dependent DNA helicase PcrA